MTDIRTFPLEEVLSVSTGHLVCQRGIDAIYDLEGHMVGPEMTMVSIAVLQPWCSKKLHQLFPELRGVAVPVGVDSREAAKAWTAALAPRYGAAREVPYGCVVISKTDYDREFTKFISGARR